VSAYDSKSEETLMLELYVYGPHFGPPDGSQFCIKALTLLKMSGLAFEAQKMNFKEAPKGKVRARNFPEAP
jgi:hypothetical protein